MFFDLMPVKNHEMISKHCSKQKSMTFSIDTNSSYRVDDVINRFCSSTIGLLYLF